MIFENILKLVVGEIRIEESYGKYLLDNIYQTNESNKIGLFNNFFINTSLQMTSLIINQSVGSSSVLGVVVCWE
jgi:hypothetical protein